jgi:DNA-3-methyladenine glycosylase I
MSREGIVHGADGVARCWWSSASADYAAYHDQEWGLPVSDDRLLFEKLCLEGFQSGLSWLTILRKRPAFRRAFDAFEIERVARFRPSRVDELMQDASIVRNRRKIEAVLNNAQRAIELIGEYGSLAAYFWHYEPKPSSRPRRLTKSALMKLSQSAESKALAKDLKRRGWAFVGPTTLYAFMQAMGLVNDHLEGCGSRAPVEAARARFERPTVSGAQQATHERDQRPTKDEHRRPTKERAQGID